MSCGMNQLPRQMSALQRAAVVLLLYFTLTVSGCTQFMLLGVLLGGPPSIEPDFDKETGEGLDNPDYKVAVICYAPTELKLSHPKVDMEVSQAVAYQLGANEIPV